MKSNYGYVILRVPVCQVCGEPLIDMYCTTDTCRKCCEKGRCPCESWCIVKKKQRKGGDKT